MSSYLHKSIWLIASLTFATSLLYPGAYALGPFVLFVISLFNIRALGRQKLNRDDFSLIFIFAFYAAGMFVFVYMDGWHTRELDKPSRFFIAIPVLLLLLKVSPNKEWLLYGVLVGSVGAFILGVYETSFLNFGRAQGSTHPIMFGNTALMLGLMCFVSALWFKYKKRNAFVIFALISGVLGIGASILSASRGGWVGLPFILLFLLWQSSDLIGNKKALFAGAASLLIVFLILITPQTGVFNRFEQALDDIKRYNKGDLIENSVGQRFEMWRGAWLMFCESPIIGVGEYQSVEMKKKLVDQGKLSPLVQRFNHAHNEFIDALSLRGVVGLLFLISIYLLPLYIFMKKAIHNKKNWNVKAFSLAGALVPISYIDFALSQSMFSHNIGVMMYIFPICFFWSAARWAEKEKPI